MPEYQHKPDQGPGAEKQFLLYLFFAFVMVLLFQLLFLKPQPKQPEEQKKPQPATTSVVAPASAAATAAKQPAATKAPAAERARAEQEIVVENALYRVTFTNRGAQVKSWVLKKFKDDKGKPLDLVNPQAAAQFGLPLSFWTYDEALRKSLNDALYVEKNNPGKSQLTAPATLTFQYSDGGLSVRKAFHFDHSYVIETEASVTQNGNPVEAFLAWPSALGDQLTPAGYSTGRLDWQTPDGTTHMPAFEHNIIRPNKWVANGDTLQRTFNWAGVSDQYFAAIFMPAQPQHSVAVTLNQTLELPRHPEDPNDKETVKVQALGLALGNPAGTTDARLFVGPKSVDVMGAIHANSSDGAAGRGPNLEGVIDFGFFGVFAKWLFLWLNWTHDHWSPNWGWAIILLTFIINLAFLPLRFSQMKSMLKMQKAQPRIQAIQKKYEKYGLRDSEKQQQKQAEVMAVYKEIGVNPVGGCLPMFLQLPILYAFYAVLANTIELRQAGWLWIHDLSSADPWHILPILTIISMLVLQAMTPQAGMDPAQRRMMNIMMPAMFGWFTWAVSAGLALYWTVSNIIYLVQQFFINRSHLGLEIRELQEKRARKAKK